MEYLNSTLDGLNNAHMFDNFYPNIYSPIEVDIIDVIEKNKQAQEQLNFYTDAAIQAMGLTIDVVYLAYGAYALYTCTPFAATTLGLEMFQDQVPHGEKLLEFIKIVLGICMMPKQFNYFNAHQVLNNSALQKFLSFALIKPVNLASIAGFLETTHNVFDTILAKVANEGELFKEGSLSSYVQERSSKLKEEFTFVSSNIAKMATKFVIKDYDGDNFIQAMGGDVIRDIYLYSIDMITETGTNTDQSTDDASKIDDEITAMVQKNIIKYKMCYQLFPQYKVSYMSGIGMQVCRDTIPHIKQTAEQITTTCKEYISKIDLDEFCDFAFPKFTTSNNNINKACHFLVKPIVVATNAVVVTTLLMQ